jgi:hypothetical protein
MTIKKYLSMLASPVRKPPVQNKKKKNTTMVSGYYRRLVFPSTAANERTPDSTAENRTSSTALQQAPNLSAFVRTPDPDLSPGVAKLDTHARIE